MWKLGATCDLWCENVRMNHAHNLLCGLPRETGVNDRVLLPMGERCVCVYDVLNDIMSTYVLIKRVLFNLLRWWRMEGPLHSLDGSWTASCRCSLMVALAHIVRGYTFSGKHPPGTNSSGCLRLRGSGRVRVVDTYWCMVPYNMAVVFQTTFNLQIELFSDSINNNLFPILRGTGL